MKILYICRENLPTYRSDVEVLIEEQLALHCDITFVAAFSRGVTEISSNERVNYQLVQPPRFIGRVCGDKLSKVCFKLGRALKLLAHNRYDLIIVRDNAFLALLFSISAALAKSKSVFWVSILMGDLTADDAKKRHRYFHLIYAFLYKLVEKWAVKFSDVVISQSDAMSDYLREHVGIKAEIISAPMGIDERLLEGRYANNERRGCIGYLGSIDFSRDIPMLLDMVKKLQEDIKYTHVTLKIIGGSQDTLAVKMLDEEIYRRELQNSVTVTGHLARKDAWGELAECDVCLSYIPRNVAFDVSSPTKLVEYLALGKKVVANDIPDQRLLLKKVGFGSICESNLASLVENMKTQIDYLQTDSERNEMVTRTLKERGYESLAIGLFKNLKRLAN